MTLIQLLRILKKSVRLLGGASLVAFGVVFVIVSKVPTYYSVSLSMYVHNKAIPSSDGFSYDGYYAQLAAEGYTDTVIGLFETPELAREFRNGFSQGTYADTPRTKSLQVKKIAPQILSVSYRSYDQSLALDMVSIAINSVVSRVDELNEKDALWFSVEPLDELPEIREISYSPLLFSIVAFFVVLVGGSGLVLTHAYLRGNEQK